MEGEKRHRRQQQKSCLTQTMSACSETKGTPLDFAPKKLGEWSLLHVGSYKVYNMQITGDGHCTYFRVVSSFHVHFISSEKKRKIQNSGNNCNEVLIEAEKKCTWETKCCPRQEVSGFRMFSPFILAISGPDFTYMFWMTLLTFCQGSMHQKAIVFVEEIFCHLL